MIGASNMAPQVQGLSSSMIERMHMVLSGGISAEAKGQFWVGLALALATAALLCASFLDLAMM
jgi:hypothetical protein